MLDIFYLFKLNNEAIN